MKSYSPLSLKLVSVGLEVLLRLHDAFNNKLQDLSYIEVAVLCQELTTITGQRNENFFVTSNALFGCTSDPGSM